MKFAIEGDHSRYFWEEGHILFEELLSDEKCSEFEIFPEVKVNQFLKSESVRTLVSNRKWAEIMAKLTEQNCVMLAFDLWIEEPMDESVTLEEISSVQPLVGGLLLCLEGERVANLPGKGDGVFFCPDFALEWNQLKGKYLLIGYAKERAQYILNESDPFTHALKREGLVFGDRLPTPKFPIVYRK